MSAAQNTISNLSKDTYTIKAQSTQTISFLGARPNYYRITNGGATPLYLGVSMMPTEDFFDMKIPSTTTKLYVDAHGHDEIYIYNPSITDTNIIITSFTAPFDSTVLALSDVGQDFSNIEFSGSVDASGDLKTVLTDIKNKTKDYSSTLQNTNSLLTDVFSKINNIYLYTANINDYSANIKDYSSILGSINNLTDRVYDATIQNGNYLTTNFSELKGIRILLGEISARLYSEKCTKWYKGTNTEAENLYTMKYIEFLSNDSDTDLFVTISSTGNITLKPGEVLNKIHLDETRTITIPKNSTYRLIGG